MISGRNTEPMSDAILLRASGDSVSGQSPIPATNLGLRFQDSSYTRTVTVTHEFVQNVSSAVLLQITKYVINSPACPGPYPAEFLTKVRSLIIRLF